MEGILDGLWVEEDILLCKCSPNYVTKMLSFSFSLGYLWKINYTYPTEVLELLLKVLQPFLYFGWLRKSQG